MNSFEGHPIIITETRFQELTDKEKKLDALLKAYPELSSGQKLTPAAKRYKQALSDFLDKVETVVNSDSFKGVFQIAWIHGQEYKGPTLGDDIAKTKKLLGK